MKTRFLCENSAGGFFIALDHFGSPLSAKVTFSRGKFSQIMNSHVVGKKIKIKGVTWEDEVSHRTAMELCYRFEICIYLEHATWFRKIRFCATWTVLVPLWGKWKKWVVLKFFELTKVGCIWNLIYILLLNYKTRK